MQNINRSTKSFLYLLSLVFVLSTIGSSSLLAQRLILTEETLTYEDTERPCIQVMLEPGTKTIKDNFKDWIDDQHDVKLKGYGFLTNKDVLRAEQTTISSVSPNQMDFFVKIVEEGEQSKMCIFASFGYSIPVAPDKFPQEFQALKGLTINFLSDFLSDWYLNRFEEAQEVAADLEKERAKLAKEIEKNKEEIADLKKENEKMGTTLEEKESSLQEASKTAEERKRKMNKINKALEKNKKEGGNQ